MADIELLFPPAISVQDEGITFVDDMSEVFRPALASGAVQVQNYGGPRIKMTRHVYVRQTELGKTLAFLQNIRGKGRRFYASPNYATRGSLADPELLSNNTFAAGTAGFTSYVPSVAAISATERHARVTRLIRGNYPGIYQYGTPVQYAPYAVRGFVYPGKSSGSSNFSVNAYDNTVSKQQILGSIGGYGCVPITPIATTLRITLLDFGTSGLMPGDFFDTPWVSISRCFLVDNSPNLLTYSDQIDNAAWAKNGCTISANGYTAADGSVTADGLVENTSTSSHSISQSATVSSAGADYTASAVVEYSNRTWIWFQMTTSTGVVYAYFDLSAGAIGTTSTGSGWLNLRTSMTQVGSNTWRVTITALKNTSDTSIQVALGAAPANATATYLGAGTTAVTLWRLALAQSSQAFMPSQTTSAGNSGFGQAGNGINVKGLPASASGILLEGDLVEIDGQLVMLTASLDSDAGGLGYLQFGPALVTSPDDGEAVIANYPLGKFIQSSDPQVTNRYGQYGEISFEMEQVY